MTTTVNFNPKLDKLRTQISELVQQYAEIAHAPVAFVPGQSAVPVSGKVIGTKELQLMVDASLDGWLTTGRFNVMFEDRMAKFLGVKHVLTVNSGSSANLVAFSALTSPKLGDRAIQPGDEVIGVAAGFPTTVNPILQFGAVPVFVDLDLTTHNIDASKIEAAISPKTKAIMLAHSLGRLCQVRHPCRFSHHALRLETVWQEEPVGQGACVLLVPYRSPTQTAVRTTRAAELRRD